ncbi:MAG: hypothetical protein DRJ66_03165 [Thermoprotei archaeon]|nr:MAG: hypothetical protein DRJ66_03165 [Thermoprotei archaeon]
MRLTPRCIPCIVNARANEIINYSRLSDEEKVKALSILLKVISENVTPNTSTITLASIGFRAVKELIGDDDPYREYKKLSNKIAMELLHDVMKEVKDLEGYERFRCLVVVSINANAIDPGVPPFHFDPERLREVLLEMSLDIDHTRKIYGLLTKAKRVVFLLDNAGEAVFDKVLVEEIANMVSEVIVVAKSSAYQNDVTVKDAIELGFDKVARVVGTGSDYGGPLPEALSSEVKELLSTADLIIAKGMANYEAFLYAPPKRPVAHLFKAKCKPVADTLRVRVGSRIALLKM